VKKRTEIISIFAITQTTRELLILDLDPLDPVFGSSVHQIIFINSNIIIIIKFIN